jgi:hypothetical protein
VSTSLCPACGADLPSTPARFCIECGAELQANQAVAPPGDAEPVSQALPATGATVRLSNASVEQSVLGGTVKLPTGEAIPPGMWSINDPPHAADVVAVYVPLRAIVGGWSGLIETGWRLVEQLPPLPDTTTPRFRFEALCEWFPAPGFGRGMRLTVRVGAEAEAQEGRSRRGFRYREHYDPPMSVVEAWWSRSDGRRMEHPLPDVQLMAPPRIPRISDVAEPIRMLPAERAQAWAREGKTPEIFYLLADRQQRTPAGRGLLLGASPRNLLERFFDRSQPGDHRRCHVRLLNPLVCSWNNWQRLQPRIAANAKELGLGLSTDATVEWWLDREGYDGVVFEGVADRYPYRRMVVAFRRSQVALIEE